VTRLRWVAAVVVVGVALVAGLRGGPSSRGRPATALLTGIPQAGTALGSPRAAVTVTEFADLQCPVCADFAAGAENDLIARDVRGGRVKLVYRSLRTATRDPATFVTQQAAADAAGAQGRAFQFIELFYRAQGPEGSGYVTAAFLDRLARRIPGLDHARWRAAIPRFAGQVRAEERLAASLGLTRTPTIVVTGPRGSPAPLVAPVDYAALERAISTSTTGSTARGS
jgi:protein-disulfide isomerase